ncbi:hypothetical protein B1R38_06050 [Bacillus cereus]|uniref:hypothetical protein n=1 Tax=Bacillus cereus group TaxID=86661 RepID=UPI000BFBFEB5|nr:MULTISPECIES: hypothetical protein [Bacillus cereus group]PGP49025.1 hypothetical protein CN993_00705 [Bacillus thuringiensis]PWE74345.1 hypothetical protein B1R38_06050 [Bacillus cereus]
MAIYTTLNLLDGSEMVVVNYQNAKELWREIWLKQESGTVAGLAQILTDAQSVFEQQCGGRHAGQEIMALTGFGLLYDEYTGFDGEKRVKALRLRDAFRKSHCSIEVEARANEAVELFGLE